MIASSGARGRFNQEQVFTSAGYSSAGCAATAEACRVAPGNGASGAMADGIRKLFTAFHDQRHLRTRIRQLQAELTSLKRENQQLASNFTRKVHSLESDLRHVRADRARLKRQLLDAGVGSGAKNKPGQEIVARPLVVRSERGEFLGVSAGSGAHFNLKDFMSLIREGMMNTRDVTYKWENRSPHWVLQVRAQDKGTGRLHQMALVVRSTQTPRCNQVTTIERMNIGGHDVPDELILGLFRRIRETYQ